MFFSTFIYLALAFTPKLLDAYKCDVPDEWLFETNSSSTQSFMPGTKWPGGIVKYVLHSSLTSEDRVQVQRAFDEYHRKTCIRFQPKSSADQAYTSIENDPNTCGLGHMCRTGGYQFAKFGGGCRDVATMIHELGHNLCLGHEQSRADRDRYVHFDGCASNEIPGRDDNYIQSGLYYDYESQMAYQCGWCAGGWPRMQGADRCGSDVHKGLSVLDADKINAFYGCSGCYSHRWRSINSLSDSDRANLRSYGADMDGTPLYVCRGYINGHIHPGKFRADWNRCMVPYNGGEHVVSDPEVLTNPSNAGGFYALTRTGGIPSNAVPAGSENGEPWYSAVCPLNVNGQVVNTPGKVRRSQSGQAFVPFGSREHSCTDYSVLVCS